jgi:transcriptional regulator with XRE-family HTH domain
MPRESTLKLAPLPRGKESLGQRLARFRKERGYTQTELAAKIGLIQALISDYERDKLRMNADAILRFAAALEVSTDELLRPVNAPAAGRKPSRKVLRRLELIESLPNHQQQTVLKTIDAMLRGLKTAS